jgi:hypothetical protein
MITCHKGLVNKWQKLDVLTGKGAPIAKTFSGKLFMRSWRQESIRFFATWISVSAESNIWVTSACSEEEAERFRAEIRIANSKLVISFNASCPVTSLESNILEKDVNHASKQISCLHIDAKVVDKYIQENNILDVTCSVHRKVFFTPSAGDFEKEEADTDE